jgi:hypothetical protein
MTSLGKPTLVTGPIPLNIWEKKADGAVKRVAFLKSKVPPQRGDILHINLDGVTLKEFEVLQIIHGFEQTGEELHHHVDVIVCSSSLMALLCAETNEEVH